jgi:ectoine hydroxylase-related dioxygenase (phytanoyl-CoA dioxygenase family)
MLTAQQQAHFATFGFLWLRQCLRADEIAAIRQAAEAIWQEERQRRGLADDAYLTLPTFLERSPTLMALLTDERIYGAVTSLLGPDFLWSGSEGNTGVAMHNQFHAWHSDRCGEAEPDYRRLKLMIYLTPVRKETGCLRVIPSSHKLPLYRELDGLNQQQADTCEQLFGLAGQDLPAFALETTPGDVVLFDHYLYHGVYKGDGSRRYLAMKFVSQPTKAAHFASLLRFSPYIFEPDPIFAHSDQPRLRQMVAGLARLKELAQAQKPG